ncbi:hypothetical protein K8Z61_08190 [Nocardioides sp. TRM66260-LWL]|uniref:hypothetical protein n=1 Tax=Nocardioides sp. TRM66260-LWL TaxID=2874478 RepID=UPI001CC5D23A|nr:hypothetical protein [Nocardioides sp. TRM66260-LWL]MBZ5734475.1 hypothetical protein [Nocardioides sp. TRM66260-LWL]
MQMPLVRPLALLLGCLLLVGPLAPPGSADTSYRISLGEIAVPGPGRLTAQVTTDAPAVHAWIYSDPVNPLPLDFGPVPVSGGAVTLDLETWGASSYGDLVVQACAAVDDCDGPIRRAAVSPSDVQPTIRWSDVSIVRDGDGPYEVSVDDPGGGGTLAVDAWLPKDPATFHPIPVARHGASAIVLPEGRLTLRLLRCDAERRFCRAFDDDRHDVLVRRTIDGSIDLPRRDVGALPIDVALQLPPLEGTFDAELVLRDAEGSVVPGAGGVFTGLRQRPIRGPARVRVDLSRISESGTYVLSGRTTFEDADLGTLHGSLTPVTFHVDAVPPQDVEVVLSSTSVFPYQDGYRDSMTITTHVDPADRAGATVVHQIVSRGGVLVTLYPGAPGPTEWNGRRLNFEALPAGRYSLHTAVYDDHGNVTRPRPRSIFVSHQRLRQRSYARTVSALGSMTRARAGSCSSVVVGAVRVWRNGVGLRPASRCTGNRKRRLVTTEHALTAPRAVRYDLLMISLDGGAGRGALNSSAVLNYGRRYGGFGPGIVLEPALGPHPGSTERAATYVTRTGRVRWRVVAETGSYDLKRFTVRLVYTRLE